MTDHQTFLSDESGAVTVDWVVLTAALVGLGLAVMAVIATGIDDLSNDISDSMEQDNLIRVSFASDIGGALSGAAATAIRDNARGLQNDALGAAYAAAQTIAADAQTDVDALGYGNSAYATLSDFQADHAGTTSTDFDAHNAALAASSAASQTASLINDEGTQRGLTFNSTTGVFE